VNDQSRRGAIHELKTDALPFHQVVERCKTFEIRRDDREFGIGDTLFLRETMFDGEDMRRNKKPLIFTGRDCYVRVIGIMRGPIYGLAEGWVILSIEHVS